MSECIFVMEESYGMFYSQNILPLARAALSQDLVNEAAKRSVTHFAVTLRTKMTDKTVFIPSDIYSS